MASGNGVREGIDQVAINPAWEPISSAPSNVSAQQEAEFFAKAKLEHDRLSNRQNLGFLGTFFGSNSAAPTNIAGLVILISFAMIGVSIIYFVPELKEMRGGLLALIGSCLAFIFGASTKKD